MGQIVMPRSGRGEFVPEPVVVAVAGMTTKSEQDTPMSDACRAIGAASLTERGESRFATLRFGNGNGNGNGNGLGLGRRHLV